MACRKQRASAALVLMLAACSWVGCSRPSATTTAELPSPTGVATAAIERLDADHTGSLSAAEISASPAFVAAQEQFDVNQDGAITQAEIEQRINGYHKSSAVMMMVPCRVTFGGRALGDAEVVFEPEPFMGNTAAPARGRTERDGSVRLLTEGESVPGLLMGLYRIRVSKKDEDGQELIPSRYNVQTELGQEIALENRKLAGGIYLQLEAR